MGTSNWSLIEFLIEDEGRVKKITDELKNYKRQEDKITVSYDAANTNNFNFERILLEHKIPYLKETYNENNQLLNTEKHFLVKSGDYELVFYEELTKDHLTINDIANAGNWVAVQQLIIQNEHDNRYFDWPEQVLLRKKFTDNPSFAIYFDPLFIKKTYDFNQRDFDGYTALMHAIELKDDNLVKLLINVSDLDVRDNGGTTALMKAVVQKLYVSDLLSAGANIDIKNIIGRTALMSSLNDITTCRILLEAGADASIEDSFGCNALKLATGDIKALIEKHVLQDSIDESDDNSLSL